MYTIKTWYTLLMSFWTKLKEIFVKGENVLFSPEKCICCGREKIEKSSPFCDACKEKVSFISGRVCDKCGKPINAGKVCDKCKNIKWNFDKARTCVVYDEFSSSMITKFKYSKAKYLGERLSDFLVDAYANYPELSADIVTFVAITEKKLKQRGFNQTEVLAKLFAEKSGLECKSTLVKVKETKAQAGLDRTLRMQNLKNSFSIKSDVKSQIKGKNILLIDDVFTTGSTACECAKVLKKAGASGVFVLTVAKTI